MTLQNKGSYRDKLTLYIEPNKKPLIEKARKMFKQEGSSLSTWFINQLESYMKLHYPGNPQLTFNNQAKLNYPKSARVQKPLLCHCGQRAIYELHMPYGETLFTCSSHATKEKARYWKEIKNGK